jgi:hypothetical protein
VVIGPVLSIKPSPRLTAEVQCDVITRLERADSLYAVPLIAYPRTRGQGGDRISIAPTVSVTWVRGMSSASSSTMSSRRRKARCGPWRRGQPLHRGERGGAVLAVAGSQSKASSRVRCLALKLSSLTTKRRQPWPGRARAATPSTLSTAAGA